MESKPDIDQCNNLWIKWNRTSRAMVRARDRELQQAGIPAPEAGVVFFLKSANKAVNPRMLSHFLHRDPQQVSKLLDQMEEDGLLTRVRDPAKRNRVRITLTEKGEEAYERLSQANVARMAIFSCLTRKQRDDLEIYLEGLYRRALDLIRPI